MSEAEDLANLLNAGSLDAPLKILNEVTIGPQLGEANVKSGLYSFIIALLVVLAYMLFYYRGARIGVQHRAHCQPVLAHWCIGIFGGGIDAPWNRRDCVDHWNGGRCQRLDFRAHP